MPPMLDLPSPNHDVRSAAVRFVVLHYTGMVSGEAALERLRDPAAKVSAHYVVGEAGEVWRLVAEDRRAWHAGVSRWQDWHSLNDVSIGIEIVNPGHEWGLTDYPAAQIAALLDLLRGARARHGLDAAAFLGHSDVAPARKDDPGELFPWRHLARHGFGLWPEATAPARPAPDRAAAFLAHVGYPADLPGTAFEHLVRAFQRRFRQHRVDGRLDPETMGLIEAVAALPWRR